MLPSWSPLLCLLLAISSVWATTVSRGTGKTTLKLLRGIDTAGFRNLAERDRAHVQALAQVSHLDERSTSSINVANAVVFYTTEVGIGTPPAPYTLLVDTGSSISWVGADKQYVATNSSVDTGGFIYSLYGSGAFFGEEWRDTISLDADLVVRQQTIGVANWTTGISGVDGFLGLGPVNLTMATSTHSFEVPTITDNLYDQGMISQDVLGIFLVPASEPESNGTITFGGYDDSVITSAVNYVSLTTQFPASQFWGIDQSVSYGGVTILSSTAGIVDTGTTLILIATEAFIEYQALTGATMDLSTGMLTITASQYANLQTLSFHMGGTTYDLTPNAQIWPRSLNTAIGGNASAIYLVVGDVGFPDGLLFNFVNGYCFLERYYSIFDTGNQRVGFAETMYTYSDTN